jgi:hypothetical protein
MNHIESFKEIIKGVKFTPPQQKIVDKLLKGYTIRVINKHRMSGGEYVWKKPNSENLEYAGKIYKAFWNVLYQIRKQKGISLSTKGFID